MVNFNDMDFSEVENPDIREAYEKTYSRYLDARTEEEKEWLLHILGQIGELESRQITERKEALKRTAFLKFGWDDCSEHTRNKDQGFRGDYQKLYQKLGLAKTPKDIFRCLRLFRKLGQWEANIKGNPTNEGCE